MFISYGQTLLSDAYNVTGKQTNVLSRVMGRLITDRFLIVAVDINAKEAWDQASSRPEIFGIL